MALEEKIKARLGELVFALTTMEEKIDVQQETIDDLQSQIDTLTDDGEEPKKTAGPPDHPLPSDNKVG